MSSSSPIAISCKGLETSGYARKFDYGRTLSEAQGGDRVTLGVRSLSRRNIKRLLTARNSEKGIGPAGNHNHGILFNFRQAPADACLNCQILRIARLLQSHAIIGPELLTPHSLEVVRPAADQNMAERK